MEFIVNAVVLSTDRAHSAPPRQKSQLTRRRHRNRNEFIRLWPKMFPRIVVNQLLLSHRFRTGMHLTICWIEYFSPIKAKFPQGRTKRVGATEGARWPIACSEPRPYRKRCCSPSCIDQ